MTNILAMATATLISTLGLTSHARADDSFPVLGPQYGSHVRERIVSSSLMRGQIKAGYQDDDVAVRLLDNPRVAIRSLRTMERKNLKQSSLRNSEETAPWSGDYWAIYLGILGKRYGDEEFPMSRSWRSNFRYVSGANSLASHASSRFARCSVENLSPSEKYDLLVGDPNFTLTKKMWETGQEIYEENEEHKVETWMGICHGWAVASYVVPRPRSKITVMAADGRTWIDFYPSDLKALASLLWANADVEMKFSGGRCYDEEPVSNSANGRIRKPECFDTNPASLHLALVNRIGVERKSFVMDATYDYEVWNHPVTDYSYTYFNPQTKEPASSLEQATVEKSAFLSDPFKRHRSPKAEKIVGIEMKVTYAVETEPTKSPTDDFTKDAHKQAVYKYDLELDAQGRIIGGEWYQANHPDFLWTPVPGEKAAGVGDRFATGAWTNTRNPMPETWQKAAPKNSRESIPLAKVLDRLIAESLVR